MLEGEERKMFAAHNSKMNEHVTTKLGRQAKNHKPNKNEVTYDHHKNYPINTQGKKYFQRCYFKKC